MGRRIGTARNCTRAINIRLNAANPQVFAFSSSFCAQNGKIRDYDRISTSQINIHHVQPSRFDSLQRYSIPRRRGCENPDTLHAATLAKNRLGAPAKPSTYRLRMIDFFAVPDQDLQDSRSFPSEQNSSCTAMEESKASEITPC